MNSETTHMIVICRILGIYKQWLVITTISHYNHSPDIVLVLVLESRTQQTMMLFVFWQLAIVCWIRSHGPASTQPSCHLQFINTKHCRLGIPHKSCSFGEDVTQSSHHNLALVIVRNQKPNISHLFYITACYNNHVQRSKHYILNDRLIFLFLFSAVWSGLRWCCRRGSSHHGPWDGT